MKRAFSILILVFVAAIPSLLFLAAHQEKLEHTAAQKPAAELSEPSSNYILSSHSITK